MEIEPSLKRNVSLLQVAVPSRGNIRAYRELKAELAALVGEVNGRHGEVDWTPIRYLNKGFSQLTLAGFYRTAHVGLVTPLHDGMNLVAKEYVAAQNPFDPGVLVLSAFAGAAKELDAALLVNPHDIDGMARQIATALAMSLEERRERWQQHGDKLRRAFGAGVGSPISCTRWLRCAARRRGWRIRGPWRCRCARSPSERRSSADSRNHRDSAAIFDSVLAFTARILVSPGIPRRLLQGVADLVALFVDRGDHRPGRHAQSDQRRFGELQARFDGLRHGIGGAEAVKMAGMLGVARARDDENIGPHRAHMLDHVVDELRVWMVMMTPAAVARPQASRNRRIGGVAVINVVAVAAVARHGEAHRNRRRYRECRAP